MSNVALITSDDLTSSSPLGGNIDIDKYSFIITEEQLFTIEPILGTKLFNKIQTDFVAETITGVYETILDNYIKPILIYKVSAEYITISSFQSGNAGLFRYLPENTEPLSQKDVDYFANKQRAKADVYVERLQRYLCDSENDIPEYTAAQDNNFDQKPDKDINIYGGWRLSNDYTPSTSAEREMWRDIWHDEGR